MAGPTEEERRVPPYVALVRIGAVIAMSVFAALGLFILIGSVGTSWGWSLVGLISLALAVPFFFVMRLVENTAQTPADEAGPDA